MLNDIETIYYMENPETEQTAFATGTQLKYEDIIKDVFGVACIQDLSMMIQYNKNFQTSICQSYGVLENEVSLDMILRVASKMDLLQLRKKLIDQQDSNEMVSCPFDTVIRLQEGIFEWDEEHSSYNLVENS